MHMATLRKKTFFRFNDCPPSRTALPRLRNPLTTHLWFGRFGVTGVHGSTVFVAYSKKKRDDLLSSLKNDLLQAGIFSIAVQFPRGGRPHPPSLSIICCQQGGGSIFFIKQLSPGDQGCGVPGRSPTVGYLFGPLSGERGNIMNRIMHYFVCIFSVVAFASCASMPIAPIEDRSMQKVHDIDLTKNEIYDISLEWMARTFFDNKEVIELKDKDNGKIIGKGITMFSGKIGWFSAKIPCRFTLMVEAKDNKYRTTYNNLVGLYGENQSRPEPLTERIC